MWVGQAHEDKKALHTKGDTISQKEQQAILHQHRYSLCLCFLKAGLMSDIWVPDKTGRKWILPRRPAGDGKVSSDVWECEGSTSAGGGYG